MDNGADGTVPSPPERSGSVVAAFAVMFAAATVTVGMRLYTRVKFLRGLKVEDWLILVAWVLSLGVTIGFIRQTTLALGKHAWTLSPEILRASGKEEFYSFLFYTLSLSFTKTSILLLYRRILPPGPSRTVNYVLLAVVMACNIFAVVVSAATCVPLPAAWDPRVEGKCLGEVVRLGNSILNVLTDFSIFSLPLPSIVRLRMHWRKKVGLLVVFTLGFLVCVVSMVRVVILSKMDRGDATYNLAVIAYWGAVEVNLPICCACLTTIRPLLNKLLPGILGQRTTREKGTSHGLSSQPRRHVGDQVATTDVGRCQVDDGPSSSSGESLVIMLPEVEAYEGGLGVRPPPKAYAGRTGKVL